MAEPTKQDVEDIVSAVNRDPAAAQSDAPSAEQLSHGRNCSALRGSKPPIWDAECTCGLGWRIQVQTEREMHNAWRKRAEEAEARLLEMERSAHNG